MKIHCELYIRKCHCKFNNNFKRIFSIALSNSYENFHSIVHFYGKKKKLNLKSDYAMLCVLQYKLLQLDAHSYNNL